MSLIFSLSSLPFFLAAPLWLLGAQLESLQISSPSYTIEPNVELQDQLLRAAINLIRQAPNLSFLSYSRYFGWPWPREEAKKFTFETLGFLSLDQLLQQVLPCFASISSVSLWTSWGAKLSGPIRKLFSYLQEAHATNLFQPLETQDILQLGRIAREEEDHELKRLSDYLLDDELAEEMAGIWNERYEGLVGKRNCSSSAYGSVTYGSEAYGFY